VAVMMKPRLLQPIFECDCRTAVCRCGAPEIGDEIEPEDLAIYPRTMWLDGGTHSGWGIVWFDPDVLFDNDKKPSRAPVAWWAGMVVGPEVNHIDYIMAKLRMPGIGGEGMCVGAEDFVVGEIRRERTFLSSPRTAAMLEWALHRGQREADGVFRRRTMPPKQAAVDAMHTINDSRLKLWDMYLPGADHPRDAIRHCLLWIRRLKVHGEDFYDTWHFADAEEGVA
jgi:hypothetical protein